MLLLADDVAALLTLVARVGSEPLPIVFAVAGGFLLKLHQPENRRFPGVVRLRSLAADLFVPCDALLLPALFDDEALGLTRARGLVFLPGSSVLAYDPTAALSLASFLTARHQADLMPLSWTSWAWPDKRTSLWPG